MDTIPNGTKVYYDGFTGLVAAKVIGETETGYEIEITARTNRFYKHGERISVSQRRLVARKTKIREGHIIVTQL